MTMIPIKFVVTPSTGHVCYMGLLEATVQAHRYLYHVAKLPAIADGAYDLLAGYARSALPMTSKVHCPGGLYLDAEDYTDQERQIAHSLIF